MPLVTKLDAFDEAGQSRSTSLLLPGALVRLLLIVIANVRLSG